MASIRVPITKGKGFIEVDTEALPDAVYAEALLQGLKVMANRGMTKITKELYPNEEELKAAAMAKAEQTKADLLAGKVRIMGAKSEKVSGALNTEAMRIARGIVKDAMKREGIKVSYVDAKDITAAAKTLLASQPEILEQAKASLEQRSKVVAEASLVNAIPVNAAKKAKVEKDNAEKRKSAPLSAAKAGKVQKHKPQAHA